MRLKRNIPIRKSEGGIIITLVAVFMLGVIGAMAALSIDVVTLYTARSEAQLAADAGALAGARVLANSGMTSAQNGTLGSNAVTLASAVAAQVAASSTVGGRPLVAGGKCPGAEICVSIPQTGANFYADPQVTVQVQRTDLPTFFARIWGAKQVAVKAQATAEAYNPSYSTAGLGSTSPPVEPVCVKPWLLSNIDPSNPGTAPNPIFVASTGSIPGTATNLLGWYPPASGPGSTYFLRTNCTSCAAPAPPPAVMLYYPGTTDAGGDFPPPSSTSCDNCTGLTPYQMSIAGCVKTPIACNAVVHVDTSAGYTTRDTETGAAVNILAHSASGGGDTVDPTINSPSIGSEPFQFVPGADNPLVLSGAITSTNDVMLSDSLVTVPVIDTSTSGLAGYPAVQIVGFMQLFVNQDGANHSNGQIPVRVINLVGCGTPASGGASGAAILGNGNSPVAVRLISSP